MYTALLNIPIVATAVPNNPAFRPFPMAVEAPDESRNSITMVEAIGIRMRGRNEEDKNERTIHGRNVLT
jgi:hypothetical protein